MTGRVLERASHQLVWMPGKAKPGLILAALVLIGVLAAVIGGRG